MSDRDELGRSTLHAALERAAQTAPAELRARGIVPTPLPVAQYALRRVDSWLREELCIAQGLASPRVVVVDPAVGTGVWLAALLTLTHERGSCARLLGIDTDPRALAVVEALLRPEATRRGAELTLRCANTLELASVFPDDDAVRVIVGNPPWAARSLARGGALSDAWLEDFRRDHAGHPLGERRSGVLSDDYVRFFRWTLEQARGARSGAVVCLATNASYLDGPVHRGMRAALVEAFERLEVLDLGGNVLLSRVAARASAPARRDDNVFGVRVGAALTCALRRPALERAAARATHSTEVSFARVEGTRVDKLAALDAAPLATLAQTPCAPWFHFRPYRAEVGPGFSLAEAFPFHREGVQTNRDALATADSLDTLTQRLDAIERGAFALSALPHFDPVQVRRALIDARERGETRIERLAYRPFDERFFVTVAPLCHRSRPDLRRAMAHSERSLLAVRKDRGGAAFNLFGSARQVADACFLSTRSSCRTRVFPSHTPDGDENLSPVVAERLTRVVGREVQSRELIAYALGTLGSPVFRTRHAAALRLDYARLPWPRDSDHFARTRAVGEAFDAALHDALPLAPVGDLTRAWDDERAIPAARLTFENGCVSCEGDVLLRAVEPAWWDAQVGHHRLVAAQLGPLARPDALRAALSRARHWSELEAQADALQ